MLPVAFFIALVFAAMALIVNAVARSYDLLSNYFTVVVMPLVFLSGVYFPLTQLPEWLRTVAQWLPMTAAVDLVRPLALGRWPANRRARRRAARRVGHSLLLHRTGADTEATAQVIDNVLLVLTNCPDADVADRLARTLVEQRLAACVNQLPAVRSTYRWQGAVERAVEVPLLIKTTRAAARGGGSDPDLHPYEVPEIVAWPVTAGLPSYLDWVADETRPQLVA